MDTEESRAKTALAVFADTGRLVPITSADGNDRRRVDFVARAGTTYAIAVDGFARDGDLKDDDIKFRWLTNDVFEAAEEMHGLSGTRRAHNRGATRQEGEPQHGPVAGGVSVWYRWQAPADREVTMDTHGSNFATLLAVYTGTKVDELHEIKVADVDAARTSQISFNARATSSSSARNLSDGVTLAMRAYLLKLRLAGQAEATPASFPRDLGRDRRRR